MNEQDFQIYGIINFTPADIVDTGASLESVDVRTIETLQAFRTLIGKRIGLLHNGLTTGNHRSVEHPSGRAVDFYFLDGAIDNSIINTIVWGMIRSGFNGIGVYWNGQAFSFHGDLRENPAAWAGKKSRIDDPWVYNNLYFYPL
jgi:hypothetical protein